MKRRKALVVSIVGALLLAGLAVAEAALLRMSPPRHDLSALTANATESTSVPTPDATTPPEPVIEYMDVYETVPGQASPSPAVGADGPAGASPAPDGSRATLDPTAPVAPIPGSPDATTAPVAPTTTVLATTTTTWPAGVPKDWPADKPIPPMPPDCEKPQLEDNGVWNCDH